MPRRLPRPVVTASVAVGVAAALALSACSGGGHPTPSATATRTPSSTPTRTTPASSTPSPSAGGTATSDPQAGGGSTPVPDQTGSPDDGTGPGTGNGSGVEDPPTVDWSAISAQGIAAAGGGTVLSLAGSGDSWTVVVAGPDGSLTQSVVSATLGRVTSGPFPKAPDAGSTVTPTLTAALRVDAAAAARKAADAVSGTLSSVRLGGSGTSPVWTASVSVAGAARQVTVDGVSGATRAS